MTVRLGFIGCGYIAGEHLRRVVADPLASVVALCDTDPAAAATIREAALAVPDADPDGRAALASAPVYTDHTAMFAETDLDAVFICLPPFAHGAAELDAVAAGAGILVEKPVALDLAPAQRVAIGLRDRGLVGASGYQSRYSRIVPFLDEQLAGRTIGMALGNRFTRLPGRDWYRVQARSGGQVVEMVTHQVDLLRRFVGEIDTVYAAAGRRISTDALTDIFDVQVSTLTFANGAVGSLATNLVSGHGNPLYARGVHIFAEGRTVSVLGHEGERRTIQTVDADGRQEHDFEDDSMTAQDRAFVRAVLDKRPDDVASSYLNGVRTLAVTLALQQSAETGQPVRVADLLDAELFA